ncbi:MAG: efflux RND transporter periplasmic adaptor subunit [Desulfatibacillum sp.]|nr:efflux RND transporter periplasmic adaptor subunit [Desulfatibacillum sp.]
MTALGMPPSIPIDSKKDWRSARKRVPALRNRFPMATTLGPMLLAAIMVLHAMTAWAQGPDARELRVLLIPRTETVLASEVAARIEGMTVDLGDRFKRGQPLVIFDRTLFGALVDKARAEREEARHTFENNRKLEALNSVSTLDVAVAQARLDRAEAELALKIAQEAKCTLHAPFSGRLVRREAEPFSYATPGQPLLRIVDDTRLALQLLVPSRWTLHLPKGSRFRVRVDETGKTYPARVTTLGARVDPVSQTLEIRGEIQGAHGELMAGMSGTAVFDDPGLVR